MGERWHLVRGYGFDALCGVPWRSSDRMTMERRAVSCLRCLTAAQLSRPTIKVMVGGESGEDSLDRESMVIRENFGPGDGGTWLLRGDWVDDPAALGCPAPSPEAP